MKRKENLRTTLATTSTTSAEVKLIIGIFITTKCFSACVAGFNGIDFALGELVGFDVLIGGAVVLKTVVLYLGWVLVIIKKG